MVEEASASSNAADTVDEEAVGAMDVIEKPVAASNSVEEHTILEGFDADDTSDDVESQA